MEIGLVFWELTDARPRTFRGRSHEPENLLKLVFISGSWEQGSASVHFGHDAAGRPYIDRGVVRAGAEKDVGSAIPESDDFVGERIDGDPKGSCETKVSELELTLVVYQ